MICRICNGTIRESPQRVLRSRADIPADQQNGPQRGGDATAFAIVHSSECLRLAVDSGNSLFANTAEHMPPAYT